MRPVMIAAVVLSAGAGMAGAGEERLRLTFAGDVTAMTVADGVTRIGYDGDAVTECRRGDCLSPNGGVVRCVGRLTLVRGVLDEDRGACRGVAADGSEWFWTYGGARDFSGGEIRSSYAYAGGTGRFAGLTGGGECVRAYGDDASHGLAGTSSDCTGRHDGAR